LQFFQPTAISSDAQFVELFRCLLLLATQNGINSCACERIFVHPIATYFPTFTGTQLAICRRIEMLFG
jgi:hypothetical protein